MQYSIVNLSEVRKNSDFRIDAEYYHPFFTKNANLINDEFKIKDFISNDKILNIKTIKKNFQYLEISNIYNNYYDTKFIDIKKEKIPDRATYILQDNDICVSTVRPNLNAVAFIKNNQNALLVGTSGLCVLRSNKKIMPEFLYIFTKTSYFINCLIRENKSTMYPAVSDNDIKNVNIFLPNIKFQSYIASLVNKSYTLRQSADTLYKEAEDILLEELGFKDYQIKNQKCFVKNLSDTQKVSRIDAEYFQPKYEDLINKIKEYKGGYFQFEDQDIKDKNFTPKKGVLYKYIELANIGLNCDIHNIELIDGDELPTRARRIVKENDVILSSVEGSLNSISLINKNLDGALCSTGFFVIESKKISPQTLLILLKSVIGQMQLKRGCSGTILTAISKDELKNIKFPLLPESIQSTISAKLHKSFLDRQKSLDLLAVAKGAVEVAVEDEEDVAFGYIDNNL